MAESVQLHELAIPEVNVSDAPRHSAVVRIDQWWDSLDIPDALHPQTFLAYGMNGQEMPLDHGAPVRLKVARQLGYKNLKYLSRITVTDTVKNIRDGLGSGNRHTATPGTPASERVKSRAHLLK